MLARYKAELRAKGEKLTLAELHFWKPPSEAAEAEVLSVVRELKSRRERCPIGLQFVSRLRFVLPGRAVISSQQSELHAGIVHVLPVTEEMLPGPPGRHVPGAAFRRATWADLAEQIAGVHDSLTELSGALARDTVGWQVDHQRSPLEYWPAHVKTAGAVDWLGAATILDLRANRLEDALEDVTTIAAFTRFLKPARLTGWQQARMDIADVGLNVTWQLLQRPELTEADLAGLDKAWEGNGWVDDALESLDVERARQFCQFDRFRSSWQQWSQFVASSLYLFHTEPNPEYESWMLPCDARTIAVACMWRVAWSRQDELAYLHQSQALLDSARLAVQRKRWPAIAESSDGNSERYDNSTRCLLTRQLSPDLGCLYRAMQTETRRQMTITAIALQRYRLRTGNFPSRLDELQRELLPNPPHVDWMAGRPLRYRLNPDGSFSLYTVGINARDDGGDATPEEGSFISIWDGRDAVWPAAATQEEVEAWESRRMRRSKETQERTRGRRITEPK